MYLEIRLKWGEEVKQFAIPDKFTSFLPSIFNGFLLFQFPTVFLPVFSPILLYLN